MAKKEEKKTTDKETKKTTKSGVKGKGASKKSGEVKGPMGVGERKKPESRAKGKESSKTTSSTSKGTKKTAGTSSAKAKADSGKKTSERSKKVGAKKSSENQSSTSTKDLKDVAKASAKEMADKFLPDEQTREELGEMAKSFLPDRDEVQKAAKKITKNIDPDTVEKVINKVIPEEEIKKKTKETKKKARETAKKMQKKADSEKPSTATLITDYDVHLFKEGKHFHLYKKFGSHLIEFSGAKGVYFALWAPNAAEVSVIGDFNEWDKTIHPMKVREDGSGIWEVFIPTAKNGSIYKYFIRSTNGYEVEKGDPFAFLWETPPKTASVVWDLESNWKDKTWMNQRKRTAGKAKPLSVYELHIGSWKRVPEENLRSLTYRELAEELPAYLQEMNFTHVEFMPVMEHPFFGSWGYQITGYFAPSSRFGTPQDFMHLIDALHQANIGVILDWVPSHFPSDMHGLHYFDGTFLYEHADPRKGFHPDWQSYIFNYGRNEVRSFLISNALFWLDEFHIDGLRVDAVASMLYLDYSRKDGEWEPNEEGGRENLEAIDFLKKFNETVYAEFPDIITIAEESTAWPMVSKPTYMGGLGFGMKWMMGWMHDTLEYFQKDPIHRKHHQNTITFSTNYAFTENFMLPLSHDEVVYGKQALINKMPGDTWNKFANLRTMYAYMFAHPGTKLLFMGAEFGQNSEWDHDSSLEWHLTHEPLHRQVQETLKTLNGLYQTEPALYEKGFDSEGFEWIDINDSESSIVSFLRKGEKKEDTLLVVCNFTPVPRENYRIGVPDAGNWKEIFNSDAENFGGSNVRNHAGVEAMELSTHQKDHSIALSLPPMGVIYLKRKV